MVDFGAALRGAIRDVFCRNAVPIGAAADFMAGLSPTVAGVRLPTSFAVASYGASALLGSCPASGGPYGPPDPPPTGSGGQCDGVLYRVRLRVLKPDGTLLTDRFDGGQYPGAMGPVSQRPGPGAGQVSIFVAYNSGNSEFKFLQATPSGGDEFTIAETEYQRVDGQPDDCGNAPGTPSYSGDDDISYDAPDGTPVTDPVNVVVNPPLFQLNGDIVIGGTVVGPTYEVGYTLNALNGDINLNFSGGNPDASQCDPQGETDSDPPPNDEEEPEDDPVGELIGVIVVVDTSADYGSATVYGDGTPPDLLFPRVGSISFGVVRGGQRAWLNPIDVQGLRTYIPVPIPGAAIAYTGKPITGVSWTITPVYQVSDSTEE